MNNQPDQIAGKNRRTLRWLALLAIGMFGLGFAMVPLYDLICEVAGIQTIGSAESGRRPVSQQSEITAFERSLTLKFDATVHPDLPWDFTPTMRKMEVHPGVTYEMTFQAKNRSEQAITVQAIPSVIPWQATPYFNKLECFCFDKQTLAAKESVAMPLRFTVSPDLPPDINSLTLSYSMMNLAQPNTASNQNQKTGVLASVSTNTQLKRI